ISSERRVAELYAACDVFVSPATGAESFGIVLLEAMASARAIVCSDIEGYRYAVGSGPDSGAKLVPPGSIDGLLAARAALAAARPGAARATRLRSAVDQVLAQGGRRLLQALRGVLRGARSARGVVAAPRGRAREAESGVRRARRLGGRSAARARARRARRP